MVDQTPATWAQIRALQAAYTRSGYSGRGGRARRLAAAARTLGYDRIDSFRDLTGGAAGLLLGLYGKHGAAGLDMPPLDRGRPATVAESAGPRSKAEPELPGGQQQSILAVLLQRLARLLLVVWLLIEAIDQTTSTWPAATAVET